MEAELEALRSRVLELEGQLAAAESATPSPKSRSKQTEVFMQHWTDIMAQNPGRRARSSTSRVVLAELRAQAQGRIIQDISCRSSARAMVVALRMLNPAASSWGCIIRWRLGWLGQDAGRAGGLDENTVKTLAQESELLLSAMNDHVYEKQQKMLLSPKSERKALKAEIGELDERCARLRKAFDAVSNAKRGGSSAQLQISMVAAQLSQMLVGEPEEVINQTLAKIKEAATRGGAPAGGPGEADDGAEGGRWRVASDSSDLDLGATSSDND